MKQSCLQLSGLGVCTDQFPQVALLAEALRQKSPAKISTKQEAVLKNLIPDINYKPPAEFAAEVSANDLAALYAFYSIDQALNAEQFASKQIPRERTALILLSGWGMADTTAEFLESMFDADGRYASPRSFTRSVNSSLASLAAIQFGIHGPCETLTHDAWPVGGVLERAADILYCGHADVVITCWADQTSKIVLDMYQRAVNELHRREYQRFLNGPCGYGSVSMIFGKAASPAAGGKIDGITIDPRPESNTAAPSELWSKALNINPFPTDNALNLAAAVIQRVLAPDQAGSLYLREESSHGEIRFLTIL